MGVIRCFRHAESVLGDFCIYAGALDTPLSNKGIQHVLNESSNPVYQGLNFDIVFTSAQTRSIQSACIFLSVVQNKKNTIVFKNSSECTASQKTLECEFLPIVSLKELNERNYGVLEGLTKDEAIQKYGEDQIFTWRRNFHSGAPEGENFTKVVERVQQFVSNELIPHMKMDEDILIIAHQNSLRALYYLLVECTIEEITHVNFENFKMFEYAYDKNTLAITSYGMSGNPISSVEGD